MRNFHRCAFAICLLFAFICPRPALAECGATEQILKQQSASAATWGNFRNNPGSLRYESAALFTQGFAELEQSDGNKVLVFRSVPKKFLTSYSDKAKCDKYFAETKAKPIVFPKRTFSTVDEFNSWFSDFSQGKGVDGTKLYAQCDGDCSPQYTSIVRKREGKIVVDAEVICGPARDKDDNNYSLSTSLRTECAQ